MARDRVRYYFSRALKAGQLTTDGIIQAIVSPVEITYRGYTYSFIDSHQEFLNDGSTEYIFAHLVKFTRNGEVETVNTSSKKTDTESVSNLVEVSCTFIYIPNYQIICFQNIWNGLERDQFHARFKELIEAKHGNFFVNCTLEPVTDLRNFLRRISNFDKISKISAKISPPNPLFSPVWKTLKEYLKKRALEEAKISERANSGGAINSDLTKLAKVIVQDGSSLEQILAEKFPEKTFDMADAAVFMAADGYGSATVEGQEKGIFIIVKTKDNHKSFLFLRSPEHRELYAAAFPVVDSINKESLLGH